MAVQPRRYARTASADAPLRLARLAPAGEAADAAEIVASLGLWERDAQGRGRPRVLLNMISTADGRATLGGRSGPLGGPADRALFHALRGAADAVLVGAGTVRAERYKRLIRDPAHRALRLQRGLREEPLACIVSASLALDADIPLLAEPAAHVVILTASASELPALAARVEYVRAPRDGLLDLDAAVAELAERFAVRTIVCEGGPHLACQLLAAGLLDELFLTLSPKLAGGAGAGEQALRILAGAELAPPVELELLAVLRHDSQLFLRYGVLSPAGTDAA